MLLHAGSLFSALALVPCVLAAPGPVAQAPVSASAAASEQEGESRFGPPLIVNGERISDAEFRRHFVFGVGSSQLEKLKYDVFLHDELRRRVAEGADAELFEVNEETVTREIGRTRKEFEVRYPSLDFDVETRRAFLSMPLYREQIEQQQLFDRLFLPDDPKDWPEVTKEAMRSGGGGPEFLEDAFRDYDDRKKIQEERGLEKMPPVSPMWKDVWRSMVLESINSFLDVQGNPEKLPEGVAVIAEGQEIRVDDVFAEIEHVIDDQHLQDARRWLALTRALEQKLEQEGVLMSWTEFLDDYWLNDSEPYHAKLFRYQMLAHQGLGYPSTYLYLERERLEQSYKKMLQRDVDYEEALEASLERTDKITGMGEVDCEMILLSAYDFPAAAWKENGWEDARQRAAALRKRLEKGGDWRVLLERYSEFWDPPMPEDGQTAELYLLNKGRFGLQSRNSLLQCTEESSYTIFMTGHSIADHAFFAQEIGTWEGPVRGLRGYYFSKVLSRRRPSRPLSLEHPAHRDTAEIYFLRHALDQLTREVEAQGEFEGWQPERGER